MAVLAPPQVQPQQLDFWSTGDLRLATTAGEIVALDPWSWVWFAPQWLEGSDQLMQRLAEDVPWQAELRVMYDRVLEVPRLQAMLDSSSFDPEHPFSAVRRGVEHAVGPLMPQAGFNLYRSGDDSVAWHSDRVAHAHPASTVALVSLGASRRFSMRPVGGGAARHWHLNSGDLLVMGGACQRHWQHCVPKMRHAGQRISIGLRATDSVRPTALRRGGTFGSPSCITVA